MLSLIFLQYSVGIVKYCLIFFDIVLIKVAQRQFRKYMTMRSWGWFVIIQKTRFTNIINQSINQTSRRPYTIHNLSIPSNNYIKSPPEVSSECPTQRRS